MTNQRHILIDGLNLARGGGVAIRLADAFVRAGWQVTVLASRPLINAHPYPKGVTVSMHPQAAGAARSTLFRRFQLPSLQNILRYLDNQTLRRSAAIVVLSNDMAQILERRNAGHLNLTY